MSDSFQDHVAKLRQLQAIGVAKQQQRRDQVKEDRAREHMGLPKIKRPKPLFDKPRAKPGEQRIIPGSIVDLPDDAPRPLGEPLRIALANSFPFDPEILRLLQAQAEAVEKYNREAPAREAMAAKVEADRKAKLNRERVRRHKLRKRILPIRPSNNFDDV